jgi:ADP-heptose:LPS heptosyltransferase
MLDEVGVGAEASIPQLTDLSMQEFAALIERATVVVCGNTLPLHLADATRTPVVVLYSGTDMLSQWRPRLAASRLLQRPVDCAPCYRFTCPIGLPCLDVAPEDVVAAVEALAREAAECGQEAQEVVA